MRCNVGQYDTTGYQWKGLSTVVLGGRGLGHVMAFVVLVGIRQFGRDDLQSRAEIRRVFWTVDAQFDRLAANQAAMMTVRN